MEGRVQMEVVDRGRGMLPLLEGRWKEVLRELFLSRKKLKKRGGECSSGGLDILSRRAGNVTGRLTRWAGLRPWIGRHLLRSSPQQPPERTVMRKYRGEVAGRPIICIVCH